MTQRKFPRYLYQHLRTTLGREPSDEEQSLLLRWAEFDRQRRFAQILTTSEETGAPISFSNLFRSKGSVTLNALEEVMGRAVNDLIASGVTPHMTSLLCRTPRPEKRGVRTTISRTAKAVGNEPVSFEFTDNASGSVIVAASSGDQVPEEPSKGATDGDAVILLDSPSGERLLTPLLQELGDVEECIVTVRVEEADLPTQAIRLAKLFLMGVHLNRKSSKVVGQIAFMVVFRNGSENKIRKMARKHNVSASLVGRISEGNVYRVAGADISLPVSCFSLFDSEEAVPSDIRTPDELMHQSGITLNKIKQSKSFNSALLVILATEECVVASRLAAEVPGSFISISANDHLVWLDPKRGAQAAVAAAVRRIVSGGVAPMHAAVSVHLPGRLTENEQYRFREIAEGVSTAAAAFQLNVNSARVWFSENVALPLLTVAVSGWSDSAASELTAGFKDAGDFILMLGSHRGELGCSVYARLKLGSANGPVPMVDLATERQMREIVLVGNKVGLIKSIIHLSAGGLAATVAHGLICGGAGLGARIHMSSKIRNDELLFGETEGLTIISVAEESIIEIERLCMNSGVPCTAIGRVTDNGIFTFNDLLKVKVEKLFESQKEGRKKIFG